MQQTLVDSRRRQFALAAAVASFCWGCAKPAEKGANEAAPSREQAAAVAEAVAAATGVELQAVDRAGFDAVLAELHGKAVLVDFWATWCGPCLEQLPHSVKLAAEHADEGLVVVTVNMDELEDVDVVKKRLVASGAGAAGTRNLASVDGGGSAAMEAFEITGGALPHYRVYDRDGNVVRTFALDPSSDRQFTHEDVATAVREALGKTPAR
jgi:thiol-disulfide isomerase/thioredoxin